jgi:DNA-binding response OmpR family regulator
MRVLIVEDDASLGAFLQKGLTLEGHEVDLVGDGDAALAHAAAERPDLMVLDLGLPKRDGVDVLAAMQGLYSGMGVIVLTARALVEEKVKCLNLGADDILMKPFSLGELAARCRALGRRRERYADPSLRCGDVELNRMERKVTRSGVPIDLTVKEFSLLEYLLQARGRCCSRSELLSEVWQMSPDAGTNVVDVYVNYLRKKLATGQQDGASDVIETVRGQGYQIGQASGDPGTRKAIRSAGAASEEALPAGVTRQPAATREVRGVRQHA